MVQRWVSVSLLEAERRFRRVRRYRESPKVMAGVKTVAAENRRELDRSKEGCVT